uniref:Uncharacterized protein n=1 Tax=Arundo donax TaxID=35708 RepID=A0A0A9ERN3_ARUDO
MIHSMSSISPRVRIDGDCQSASSSMPIGHCRIRRRRWLRGADKEGTVAFVSHRRHAAAGSCPRRSASQGWRLGRRARASPHALGPE